MAGDSPAADVVGARAAEVRAALLDPYDLYPWIEAARFPDVAAFAEGEQGSPAPDASRPRPSRP